MKQQCASDQQDELCGNELVLLFRIAPPCSRRNKTVGCRVYFSEKGKK